MIRNVGTFLLAENATKLDAAEALGVAAARITRLAVGRGGAHNLSPASAEFIINWEAEHYRSALFGAAAAPLAQKVALVTGAASGLGCGIAQGLVEAGAAVAFCDVDDQGAKEAAAASPVPSRALPVHMDVTDEGSVAAAFDHAFAPLGGRGHRGLRGRAWRRPTSWWTCRWTSGGKRWKSTSPAIFWWRGRRRASCAQQGDGGDDGDALLEERLGRFSGQLRVQRHQGGRAPPDAWLGAGAGGRTASASTASPRATSSKVRRSGTRST
jgi:hypothetical protein